MHEITVNVIMNVTIKLKVLYLHEYELYTKKKKKKKKFPIIRAKAQRSKNNIHDDKSIT